MKAQFKYSLRAHLTLRGTVLLAVVAMNLIFGLLGYFGVYGQGGKITAVTLCSLALCGIFIICIITDFDMLRSLCTAPAGYATALTPVKSWKIILARAVTILVEDMLLYTVGIAGIVLQAFIMDGFRDKMFGGNSDWVNTLCGLASMFLGYIYIIMIVLFCIVLAKSFFYSMKAGTILAVAATVATTYVFNLLNFVLAPFGVVERTGVFYSVALIMGPNAGFVAYLLLGLFKSAALFLACSYLMERKINI